MSFGPSDFSTLYTYGTVTETVQYISENKKVLLTIEGCQVKGSLDFKITLYCMCLVVWIKHIINYILLVARLHTTHIVNVLHVNSLFRITERIHFLRQGNLITNMCKQVCSWENTS